MSAADPSPSDDAVRGMVDVIAPEYHVETIERSEHGTDFVATLALRTPDGPLEAVLKATTADLVDPVVARSEPRLLKLVGRETSIPVPTVYGYCDRHPDLPAPFVLMSAEDGTNVEHRTDDLGPAARETVLREAGERLAALHELGPLSAYGTIGVRDDDLTVLDTDDHPQYDDFREKLLADVEDTLDSLTDGGFFPDRATEPERFADLVPELREYLLDAVPRIPEPGPPTYNYWDYRYGNLLLNTETGTARAVLDWANLSAADAAYNLATVEANLLAPERDGQRRTGELRETYRSAYAASREDWTFDEATRERMDVYRLTDRLGRMACLPLWYQDATPERRDEVEAAHRRFVARYL